MHNFKINREQVIVTAAIILIASLFTQKLPYALALLLAIPLIALPGFLYTALQHQKKENLAVYTAVYSIIWITILGIFINCLRFLGLEQPLTWIFIKIIYCGFVILLAGLVWVRNKVIIIEFQTNRINQLFVVAALSAIVFAVLGARLMNNGNNTLSFITLAFICLLVIATVLKSSKLENKTLKFVLYASSLSILFLGWLRGSYVSGVDTNLEFQIFSIVQQNGFWSPNVISNAYNACLSITIFPVMISGITGVSNEAIFKIIVPTLFALTPIVIFELSRKIVPDAAAFLSALFFVIQPTFIKWMQIPIRQQIAFLLFAGLLLLIFSDIGTKNKKRNIMLIGFGLITAHYSTAYLAVAIVLGSWIVSVLWSFKFKSSKPIRNRYIEGTAVLVLVIITVVWWGPITHKGDGVVTLVKNSVVNIGNSLDEDLRAEQSSPIEQFKLERNDNKKDLLETYAAQAGSKYRSIYNDPLLRSGTQKSFVAPLDTKPSKIGTAGARNTYLFFEAIKKLFKALILLGGAVLLWRTWKGKVEHVEFVLLILVSLAGLVALIVLPYISLKYDILRGYQQVLIPVASLAIIGLYAIIPRPLSPYKPAIACALFVLFFVYSAGMVGQIIGGTTVPMQLNNQGEEYNQYYVHKGEILSGQWIAMQNTRDPIFAGTRASDKLRLSYPSTIKKNIVTDVFPHTITNKGYVYTSWLNVRGREYVFVQGITIPYIYPTSFIDETKNLVYSNQDSRIYSR